MQHKYSYLNLKQICTQTTLDFDTHFDTNCWEPKLQKHESFEATKTMKVEYLSKPNNHNY